MARKKKKRGRNYSGGETRNTAIGKRNCARRKRHRSKKALKRPGKPTSNFSGTYPIERTQEARRDRKVQKGDNKKDNH